MCVLCLRDRRAAVRCVRRRGLCVPGKAEQRPAVRCLARIALLCRDRAGARAADRVGGSVGPHGPQPTGSYWPDDRRLIDAQKIRWRSLKRVQASSAHITTAQNQTGRRDRRGLRGCWGMGRMSSRSVDKPVTCCRRRGLSRRGGSGGIRTHGRVSPSPVFKTGAFNRSATLPVRRRFYRRPLSGNSPQPWRSVVSRVSRER